MNYLRITPFRRVQVIARGRQIRELPRLAKAYGKGNGRKLKGEAGVQLQDGSVHDAELHWYEASGIGKKEEKIKHLLD